MTPYIKQTIDQEAEKATELILSGLGCVQPHPFVRDAVRAAYVKGRADEAAKREGEQDERTNN